MTTTIKALPEKPMIVAMKAKHSALAASVRAAVAGSKMTADQQAEALAWIDATAEAIAQNEQALYAAYNLRNEALRAAAG